MENDNTGLQEHDLFLQRTDVEQRMMTPVLACQFPLQSVFLHKQQDNKNCNDIPPPTSPNRD